MRLLSCCFHLSPTQAWEVAPVRVRSLAIVMLLALVAAIGVIAVRELTRPTPPKAVPPIEVRTAPGMRGPPDPPPRSQAQPAPARPSADDVEGDDGGDA
jgi:hypothetical protein